ncbi:hypothetical protein FB451DRAFT_1411498 [Mycena latifolia]|nr:hypothetical protein FB451DRAFT_1411498 [Mycena latifolia]
MANLKNNSGTASASNGPASGAPASTSKNSYTACVPPFYPHSVAHRDVWAIMDSADGRIYMVKRGVGTGFFTNSYVFSFSFTSFYYCHLFPSDDANAQTNGYGNSSQQSYRGWDLACDGWEDFCEGEHRGNCPPFNLAAGFAAAYPTPSVDRPPAAPIPMSAPSPYAPIPVATAAAPRAAAPAYAPTYVPISPTTPTLANSQCVLSPASSTSTVSSSATASPLAPPGWRSQAPASPSPLSSSAQPRVTPSTRIQLNPASAYLTVLPSAAAPPQVASGSAGASSTAPAGPMRYWAADGLALIFTSRANALAELRNVRISGGSIMVSSDLDELERMIFGSRPSTAQPASHPGGPAMRFWAVSGKSRIFADRADAVTALRLSHARDAMMMVSDDLDALEVFIDEHDA